MFMVPSQAHLSSLCLQPPPSAQHSWGSQLVREKEGEEQIPACAEGPGKTQGQGAAPTNSGLTT